MPDVQHQPEDDNEGSLLHAFEGHEIGPQASQGDQEDH